MKSIKSRLIGAVAIIALTGMSSSALACWCEPGTGSPGYWKNHPEAWPVEEIVIGGVTYGIEAAIAIMDMPVKGDKSITMFTSLVAAKLNVIAIAEGGSKCGVSYCLSPGCIDEADQWLVTFQVGSGQKANEEPWQHSHGEALYECMDDFNNGRLCAPSREYCEAS